MTDKYDGWNKNPELWNTLKQNIKTLTQSLDIEWHEEDFNNFFLNKKCKYIRSGMDSNIQALKLEGEYSFNKRILYIEERNSTNKKKWEKEKKEIENNFKNIFPDFIFPERSFKPILNPLLESTVKATLDIKDYVSKEFSIQDLQKVLGEDLTDELPLNVSFQFLIKKEKSFLKDPVKSGINEIADMNEGTIVIDLIVSIYFPIEYCQYVINSKVVSEILFFNYVESQLNAYFGYNNYPNEKVNVVEAEHYFFNDLKISSNNYRVTYPAGNIYYLLKPTLSYELYIQETKKLYDSKKQEIAGNLYDLESIKNKIITLDKSIQQLVYSDKFGEISKIDLSGSEVVSQAAINSLKNMTLKDEKFQNFLKFLDSFYAKLNLSGKLDFRQICGLELSSLSLIKDITKTNCPGFFQILNSCYNAFDNINFDIILKMKNKIYLDLILFYEEKFISPDFNDKIETINITSFDKLSIDLMKQIKRNYENQLIYFPKYLRDSYFFSKISCMLYNNKISKPAIITYNDLEVYNRLQISSKGQFNGLILNRDTIKDLYERFGSNLVLYFKSLPANTIFIIHPNIFFDSSFLGNTNLYLANRLSARNLTVELLKSISLDYIVFYKEYNLAIDDLISTSLRELFSLAKYRCIYGEIYNNDIYLLDPNINVSNLTKDLDLSREITLDKSIELYCNITNLNDSLLAYLPKINVETYTVEIPKVQAEYYQRLFNLGYENLKNDPDFEQAVVLGDLNNSENFNSLMSNFLSQADIFLNAPNNDLFLFKEKFESTDNSNLFSAKLDILYSLLSAHLYGGVVEGERKYAKNSSILVICENRIVRDHLYKNLNSRFYGDVCYKFLTGIPEEIHNFLGKRIGFITRDLLDNNIILKNVSNYIVVQNNWNINFLDNLLDYVYFNTLNSGIKEDIEINQIYFENSLEINKLYQSLNAYIKSQVLAKHNKGINFDFKSLLFDSNLKPLKLSTLTIDDIEDIHKEDLFSKFNVVIKKIREFSYHNLDKLQQILAKQLGFIISEEDLFDIQFSCINKAKNSIGTKAYVPFINNMYLDFYNLIPLYVDEKFSDINGNNYRYQSGKLQWNSPVYTECGSGYITGENKENFTIQVINNKEYLIFKDCIYILNLPESSKYMEYIKAISTSGDSLVDTALIKETVIKKKDENLELDKADNTIALSIDRINGLFSIYTSSIDKDNIRLENFNFDSYENTFVIDLNNEENYQLFISKIKTLDCPSNYLNILTSSYKDWKAGKEFIIPPKYNYFLIPQIKEEIPKFYPLIWNKKFYAILNGNFYSKLAFKLSKKFNVTLIKNLYIQSFKDSKDCKYELLRISKTLNISNLKELLNFFNQDFEKLDFLKVISIEEKGDNNQEQLIKILRQKESKLKQRIKDLRRNKYEK